jgi:hypothetical protein
MPRTYHRDAHGRFSKASKPPPPLDPALVRSLGQHRRAVEWAAEQPLEVVILARTYTTTPATEVESNATSAADNLGNVS